MPLISAGFWIFAIRRFFADRCLQAAGVLSYTVLLAVVPLATVGFGLMAAFPAFEEVRAGIEDFVYRHFLPSTGETIQGYIQQFTAQAKRLTGPGMVVLIATSLMTLAAIDRALNLIWRTRRLRRGMSGLLTYWAVLSLGPLLIAASIGLSSYVMSLPLLGESGQAGGLLRRVLLALAPLLLTTVAITMLFLAVPKQRVRVRSALVGGLLVAAGFELAKRGFALYITHFPTYEIVYGAFSAVPLFLIWVYVVWAVILFGAEVTYAMDHYRHERIPRTGPRRRLHLAVRILGHLYAGCDAGRELDVDLLADLERRFPKRDVEAMLEDLDEAGYVVQTERGGWVLRRDLHLVSLADLMRELAVPWPEAPSPQPDADLLDRRYGSLIARCERSVGQVLGDPLAELFRDLGTASLAGSPEQLPSVAAAGPPPGTREPSVGHLEEHEAEGGR